MLAFPFIPPSNLEENKNERRKKCRVGLENNYYVPSVLSCKRKKRAISAHTKVSTSKKNQFLYSMKTQ